jgi:hypothetical protein
MFCLYLSGHKGAAYLSQRIPAIVMSGKSPNSEYSSLAPGCTDDVIGGDGLKRSAV